MNEQWIVVTDEYARYVWRAAAGRRARISQHGTVEPDGEVTILRRGNVIVRFSAPRATKRAEIERVLALHPQLPAHLSRHWPA